MKKTITILISIIFISSAVANTPIKSDSISKIQLCLILDVSGSMNGLLGQAQNEIWKTVSFLEEFQKDSLETVIELAVVSYGNNGYTENGHVNLITDFTENIDQVAEDLWRMEIGGKNEFCGFAIKNSLNHLSWEEADIFKCLIIAGNESFDQGEVDFEASIREAIKKGISFNTIYCGEREKGIYENWENAAKIGKGNYANIDQEIVIDEFKTPYDHSLMQFYFDYKSTYFEEADKKAELNQFDTKGEVSPVFRDRIIYKFNRRKKEKDIVDEFYDSNWEMKEFAACLLYTSPSPRVRTRSRMPSSA